MTEQPGTRINLANFYPRNLFSRMLYRLPVLAWRLGLGPLTGRIILIVTAEGRKSGQPRSVPVEYVRYNGRKYAPVAFSEQAQWYRNVLANPLVTIQTSDGTETARASRVSADEELVAVMEAFMRSDPPLTRWYLKSLGILPTRAEILANKERVHILAFIPTEERAPHGLEVDLAWLWPLALIWVGLRRKRRR